MLFALTFIDKINNYFWSLGFFCIVIVAFGFYYIVYWFHPKLCKFFIEDAYRRFPMFTIYMIVTNGKNFCLGAIQSLLFNYYEIQMLLLLGVHFLVILIFVYSEVKYRFFRQSLMLYAFIF